MPALLQVLLRFSSFLMALSSQVAGIHLLLSFPTFLESYLSGMQSCQRPLGHFYCSSPCGLPLSSHVCNLETLSPRGQGWWGHNSSPTARSQTRSSSTKRKLGAIPKDCRITCLTKRFGWFYLKDSISCDLGLEQIHYFIGCEIGKPRIKLKDYASVKEKKN